VRWRTHRAVTDAARRRVRSNHSNKPDGARNNWHGNRTEADQVINEATQGAAQGAAALGQVFVEAGRTGQGPALLGAIALLFVLGGAAIAFASYQKILGNKAQQEHVATADKLGRDQASDKIDLAAHLRRVESLTGGIQHRKVSRSLPGITGTWTGVQTCGHWWNTEKIGLLLRLKSDASGYMDGVLVLHPMPLQGSKVPYGSYRLAGDIQGLDVAFKAGPWLLQPAGYLAFGLSLKLHDAPIRSMTGTLNFREGCSKVRLEKNVDEVDIAGWMRDHEAARSPPAAKP
jgi:hypothetical protein